MKQIQTHRHRAHTCGCQGGENGGGKDWEFGMRGCKLLRIGWISNKVLLQSPGRYSQHPVINHNGKEYEKEGIYICVCITHTYIYTCITDSLCYTAGINSAL